MITPFYENNHKDYFKSTVAIDPAPFLTKFANMLRPGATILDIGCGSGRDLRWLADKGFEPTGFELSPGLAKLSGNFAKRPIIEADFTHFDFSTLNYDALLMIGALVHVKHSEFSEILLRICLALKEQGLALLCLKEGTGCSQSHDGRTFSLWQPNQIENILRDTDLSILDFKRNNSAIQTNDIWLTYILQKEDR